MKRISLFVLGLASVIILTGCVTETNIESKKEITVDKTYTCTRTINRSDEIEEQKLIVEVMNKKLVKYSLINTNTMKDNSYYSSSCEINKETYKNNEYLTASVECNPEKKEVKTSRVYDITKFSNKDDIPISALKEYLDDDFNFDFDSYSKYITKNYKCN